MRRVTRAALVCCLVLTAGCFGTSGTGGSTAAPTADEVAESPTQTAPPSPTHVTETPTPWTETPTQSATETPPTTEREDVTVEYVVRVGSVPDEFESVTVAFSERADDLQECTGLLFDSKYDPTPTPLPTPVGDCHSEAGITVDLTELDASHSLGEFTAPGRFDGKHGLVVRDVVPVYENGTTVTDIHDTDFQAHVSEDTTAGPHGVEISIYETDSDSSVRWTYYVEESDFDPDTRDGE